MGIYTDPDHTAFSSSFHPLAGPVGSGFVGLCARLFRGDGMTALQPNTVPLSVNESRGHRHVSQSSWHRSSRGAMLGRVACRLHHFFEQSADRTPEQIALVCGGEHLTYVELDQRANRLAHHLIARGVRPGSRVGLLVDRSVEAYAALLAILKCGAAVVPLDGSFPPDRIAFIAEDAGLELLLTTSTSTSAVAEVRHPVIDLTASGLDTPATRPAVCAVDGNLCYIIYTSGTTGRPKGVAVSHRNVVSYLEACGPVYGVTARDRVYQGITFAFDFSVEEVWI